MMPAIPWIIANAHWIIPACGWLTSEILGFTSGGKKASVSQVILEFIKEIFELMKATK